jgi:hypothetical protein
MIENDLYTLCSTDPGVLAALGGNNNVYLGMIPKGQSDNPALVLQSVITTNFTAADGFVNLIMRRIQLDSYAAKYSAALTLSNAVSLLLRNFKGVLASTTVTGTIVRQEMDMPDEPGATGYVFRRMLAIDFWYYATV